jgi:hypothetical protein
MPAVGLLGPRQSGKTTLALTVSVPGNALYLDLESESDRSKLAEPEAQEPVYTLPSSLAPGDVGPLGTGTTHFPSGSADAWQGRGPVWRTPIAHQVVQLLAPPV